MGGATGPDQVSRNAYDSGFEPGNSARLLTGGMTDFVIAEAAWNGYLGKGEGAGD